MLYQLVLQLPGDSEAELDALIELEDKLAAVLGKFADVDGHYIGCGQANLFIITESPLPAFIFAMSILREAGWRDRVTAAYRPVGGGDYKVIWPTAYKGEFKIL